MQIRIQNFNTRIRIQLFTVCNADPDPAPNQSAANLRPLWYTDPPGVHRQRPRSSTAKFFALKLLDFDFNVDPDNLFNSHADPDPDYKKCGSGSATLEIIHQQRDNKKILRNTQTEDL